MNFKKVLTLFFSHTLALAIGFAIGIYALPILIAPDSPSGEQVMNVSNNAIYSANFVKALEGSDAFHWGEGKVSISNQYVSLMGKLAPGPDYKIYLTPSFVETEEAFEQVKASSLQIGEVKTFDNFLVPITQEIDFSKYNTIVIWCESFGEFITAAKFK